MSNPPDPALTLCSILDTNWDETFIQKPDIHRPQEVKRLATAQKDVIYVYTLSENDAVATINNLFRRRIDRASIDIITTRGRDRFLALLAEVERILDLPTVRSSPSTRPNFESDGDWYTANQYDQIVPINKTKMEDRVKKVWRCVVDCELRSFLEVR